VFPVSPSEHSGEQSQSKSRARTRRSRSARVPHNADNGARTMNYVKQFGVKPGSKVDLAKVDASFTD
jgi:hypothetical protein